MIESTEQAARRGLIVYSSKTGNTQKVAEAIYRSLLEAAAVGTNRAPEPRLAAVEDRPDPADAAWILIGFWVDRGTADAKTLQYLDSLEGRSIGFFGTLGARPDSDHAGAVRQRIRELGSQKNTFLGCFLCQGRIDPALTERFKSFPPGHPHAMTEERMQRHLEAAKHPGEADLQEAAAACRTMLSAAGLQGNLV